LEESQLEQEAIREHLLPLSPVWEMTTYFLNLLAFGFVLQQMT
jgi:hypothetical protein|tara:strand:- start:521 stop:649 length:129 start_codon:yes stop_codon:yes gene_type:complete